MRSRYSAYARGEIGHLRSSLHPGKRSDFDEKSTRAWAESSKWHKLDIVETVAGGPEDTEGQVRFTATFSEGGVKREHSEQASFMREDGIWYFLEGKVLPPKQVVREAPKVGRNEPCPCGSGKKYKKCCAL
jgi:SEC-C motif-containing protein